MRGKESPPENRPPQSQQKAQGQVVGNSRFGKMEIGKTIFVQDGCRTGEYRNRIPEKRSPT